MSSSAEIRSSFIKFFEGKGHTFVPSSPVIPVGDDTLLFANAGMNQFKDVFLGTGSRNYTRAVNSQKCIRAGGKHNDLEDVGTDTYHHTFFEMLGNWSFGDYFKAESIDWAWELLTGVWKIDASRLHATYFQGDSNDSLAPDDDAKKFWSKYLPEDRIHKGNKKDNFWEMGETGPCGPCSEIHYDGTDDKSGGKLVNAGSPDVIEIWNLVFIQFNRDATGKLTPLPAKHVDTGMGLERITRVLQNRTSNYDTDVFGAIIGATEKLAGKKYTAKLEDKTDIAFRVIADHLRTLVFAITDGGTVSNEGRGYVLRRILRRAARFGRTLGMREPFMYKLVDVVVETMGQAFGELKERTELVKTVIKSEEESFGRTLDRGLEIFAAAAEKAAKTGDISGADAFELYDTFGFPLDLTALMAREKNLKVDTAGFEDLMNQQRQRARAAQKATNFASFVTDEKLPATDDAAKYTDDKIAAKVLGWIDEKGWHTQGNIANEAAIVLDKTCFYAESGGQTGDSGTITTVDGTFAVEETEKIADCIIHRGKLEKGTVKVGDTVEAFVNAARRETKKNHTATHLLQWALQKVCGRNIAQQGSLVCPEYLRFDFTSPKALTNEQTKEVEKLVNEQISHSVPICCLTLPIEKAKKLGAMALFGEKYGKTVRVIAVGAENENQLADAFSKEFCGGTHVANTGVIGGFKIIREESVSAGVRRITALTGKGLNEHYNKMSGIVENLGQILKVPAEQICQRVEKILDDNKNLTKQLKTASKQSGVDVMSKARGLLESCEKIGQTSIVVSSLESAAIDEARQAVDMLKTKAGSAVVVFGFADGDKVVLLAGVSDDLIKKGLKAGDIVKEIAPIVDGGGGGKPQLAQAGGKNPKKLPQALNRATEYIKEKLS
ncbi:MAG: alanine--tRNA ligase [Planctomycetes bacterium GWC2_45_44]|nr:MAG: alanine--tRNA ligase [Planctomycetes bacterium GWC2_45_44]HBR19337.1 alanine--tRNA ligase [Phycisphaerales bacterium]